jgi:hypothetical protein
VVQKRLLQTNADAIDVNTKKCKQTENLSALVFANGKIILTPVIPATYNRLCAEFRHRWLPHRPMKTQMMLMDWIFPRS